MKKHFTLFFVCCAVIIAGLSLFLIFYNKKDNESVETPETEESVSGGGEDDGAADNEDDIIYATSLSLNCARTINIKPNSSVEIVGNYLTILPANANLTISVKAESGNQEDLIFSNNVIIAKGVGKYRIKFASLKSKTQEINDTIVVNVKEDVPDLISQKLYTFTVGDIKNLTEAFNVNDSVTNLLFETDNKIKVENNTFSALQIGESIINIYYNVGMFKFKYVASVLVKDIPEYKIIITQVDSGAIINGNTITYNCSVGKSLHIVYEVLNREEQHVDQLINTSLDNHLIASCEIAPPMITVKCLSKGSVNLTIICANDSESKLILTINFI